MSTEKVFKKNGQGPNIIKTNRIKTKNVSIITNLINSIKNYTNAVNIKPFKVSSRNKHYK